MDLCRGSRWCSVRESRCLGWPESSLLFNNSEVSETSLLTFSRRVNRHEEDSNTLSPFSVATALCPWHPPTPIINVPVQTRRNVA